mmetsp:Transcript_2107/g.3046  ORF Transcript_2107/g.3046 Transcript_2107/m.3046 type:complete len:368 (+) Transcript_2107:100-1203(+)
MIRLNDHFNGGGGNQQTKGNGQTRKGGGERNGHFKNRSYRGVTKGRPPKSSQSISSPFNRKTQAHAQHAFKHATTPIKSRKFVNKLDENTQYVAPKNPIHTMGVLQPSGRHAQQQVDAARSTRLNEFQALTVDIKTPLKQNTSIVEDTPITHITNDVSPRSMLSTPESTVSMQTPPASRPTSFLKLVSTSPLYSVRDELKEGSRLFRKKEYAQAIEHWMRVLRQCPHNAGVLHAIGLAYDALAAPQKCKLWLRKAAALNHVPACFVLAVMLRKGIGLVHTSYGDDEEEEEEDESIPQHDLDEAKKLYITICKHIHNKKTMDEKGSLEHWAHEAEDLIQLNFLPMQEATSLSQKPTTAIYDFSFIHHE